MDIRKTDLASKTSLTREELIDRIEGCIYGAALGDAVGLSTEFMTKVNARHLYGIGPIKFGNAKGFEFWRDNHRSRWLENDFTDDTDQLLLILQSVLATEGELIPTHYAHCLLEWSKIGFPELEKNPRGIGFTVGSVFSAPEFLKNPHKAAYAVWNQHKRNLAANGAVMRTAGLGIPYFWDEKQVATNALNAAKVTHADPRSVASAVIVSVIISRLLKGQIGGETESKELQTEMTNSLLQGSEYENGDETKSVQFLQPKPKEIPKASNSNQPVPASGFVSTLRNVFKLKPKPQIQTTFGGHFPLPEFEPVDRTRGETPAKLPENIPPGMDTYRTDADVLALFEKVILQYSFLVKSNPMCPTNSENPNPDTEESAWIKELNLYCFPKSLSDLHLDERESIGYTYKCLGSGIYCASRAKPEKTSSAEFFKAIITELTLEAGDADTNCAVAGALLGCRLGKSGLPRDWSDKLRNTEFLDSIIEQLCSSFL